uniref:synaptotagmin-like protein 2 isoform X1 n=1 Tax=Doryrhamphus excisus TaxID=161450 RepID=UPI0025AEB05A|nr:synaptotagmin-like protein 2 isoform X1 [Doryrhamphus excisus]XP_057903923.1 synaptotagmin-like protein 2 isoform X1 [Doryrhamphus excisus]XP_057903924.1 synaptotagmin-like protein 2 isoform X1 [Doryrhamphus excisus]
MEADVEVQAQGSLDLSHLTEEEQSSILQVLLRDMDLRRRDEGRIRMLQQTRTDPTLLRTLSGAWFSEASSRRHRSRMSGSDLVHATIRRKTSKCSDVPITNLFNGRREEQEEEEQPSKSPSLEGKSRLKESTEESAESQASFESAAIRKSPTTKDAYQRYKRESVSLCSILSDSEPSSLKSNNFHSSAALGSGMSLFSSGVFGAVEVKGRMQFSLAFDGHKEELRVKVHRCEDISCVGNNRSDPYVKSYLLPDISSRGKRKTAVKRKTQNPVFEQILKYKLRANEMKSRTLNLSVWHAEPLGRNVFLGQVEVALGLWDWTCTQPLWQDLQPRVGGSQFYVPPESISSRGSLLFSIKFIPEGFEGGLPLTGELHIWLQEAQGLLSKKGGAIDSFVRSYILPDAGCQSGQKTQVVKRAVSPTYNHTMVYDGFQTSDLEEACAELTVWQREGFKLHMIGGVRLSCGTGQSYGDAVGWMDSTEEEVSVWSSMIKNPNHWVETTLPIRTNLTQRSSN